MKDASIRTGFGEVRITFQNSDELNEALQELEQQAKAIQEVADRIAPLPLRTPKPGFEGIYRFTPSGSLELLRIPKKRNEAVALVLYAYHPDLPSSAEIERVLGISEVARRVLAQVQNKDCFHKVDDKYGLTFDGLRMVQEKIAPALTPPAEEPLESEQIESEQAE